MVQRHSILRAAFTICIALFITENAAIDSAAAVIDEHGQPVAEFWAMANTADAGNTTWEKCTNGQLPTFEGLQGMQAIDVFVRADGFAPTFVHLTGDDLEPLRSLPAKIILRRGTPIELRLVLPAGMTWPDGFRPEVYFAALAERNNIMRQSSNRSRYAEGAPELDFGVNPKQLGDGTYELRLADDTPPFYVGIHAPGFLRFFDAGPFTLADVKNGALEVAVPKPAVVHLRFYAPGDADSLPFSAVDFMLLRKLSGTGYLMVDSQSKEARELDLTINDLAPGEYRAGINTKAKHDDELFVGDEPNPAAFHDIRTPQLEAGETKEIDVAYAPPNPDSYRGDGTATIRILAADGSPAAGKPITVAYLDPNYGTTPIYSGTVPENGEVTLEQLTDRSPAGWPYGNYHAKSGDKRLGYFGFQPGEKRASAEFRLPPDVGDIAPNVEFRDVVGGANVSLADFRGKVVWLEFWATWCGPCQQPMKELVEVAAEDRVEWKDKVALVAISIDDDPVAVVDHFAERGWTGLPTYWTGAEGDASRSSFQAPAARAFGLEGVPTAFLLDAEGRILWRGHPAGSKGSEHFSERITAAIK